MPAKLNTICYVHNIAERLTQDFTVKEITGITRTKDDDPTKDVIDEESLGNRKLTEFWVEARHDPNNKYYLANKTNSINQNMRSTTAILVGATSRRRGRTTLAQMESTNTQNLSAALEANPIPTNINQIPNNEISEENDN
ncbi:hypothetical protein RhiirC2_792288 [Rhizophagus irregularis]|uniref:Uncharacterized protein n=1 Tax=Rhizophagus irregularis TaxID=588596 RepID=A0A2N1MHJ4_9GLOM|nr:hypothetical protein RhiirC2_792288 [Rhizophagus irregularis]